MRASRSSLDEHPKVKILLSFSQKSSSLSSRSVLLAKFAKNCLSLFAKILESCERFLAEAISKLLS